MIRISHIVFILMAVWTAGLLFWTSQSVQQAQKELRSIKKINYSELEMTRVLLSEWDYLNRPDRLEVLAKNYLTVDRATVDERKILTSAELIDNTAPSVIPVRKPDSKFELVSQKKYEPALKAKKTEVVISKPEQENFNSFIESLSSSEAQ